MCYCRRLQDAPAVVERRPWSPGRHPRDTRQVRQRRVHYEQLYRITRTGPFRLGVRLPRRRAARPLGPPLRPLRVHRRD